MSNFELRDQLLGLVNWQIHVLETAEARSAVDLVDLVVGGGHVLHHADDHSQGVDEAVRFHRQASSEITQVLQPLYVVLVQLLLAFLVETLDHAYRLGSKEVAVVLQGHDAVVSDVLGAFEVVDVRYEAGPLWPFALSWLARCWGFSYMQLEQLASEPLA